MAYPITEEELRIRLAKIVREARRKQGMTVKRAADRAEMHWRHWQKVEAADGNVTLMTLFRVGDALDIDPKDLLHCA